MAETAGKDMPVGPREKTPFVRVRGIRKVLDKTQVLDGIGFDVPLGCTVSLLGPSGCGKTTLLRSIAGLETPDEGRISIGEEVVFDSERGINVRTEDRRIGMVFQSYAIWPHMTVAENVGFPLKIRRVPAGDIARRVDEVLTLVGLGGLAERRSTSLSGGQQQRVALARAIVHEPRLLLFDEPLSNLDAKLRYQMRTELKLLQDKLGFTAVYVTHDQQEALALSDTIVVMNHGRVEATANPRDLFTSPNTPFVASFFGFDNMHEGEVAWAGRPDGQQPTDPGGSAPQTIGIGVGRCTVRGVWRDGATPAPGTPVILAFRSDRVGLRVHDAPVTPDRNEYAGTVETGVYLGLQREYVVKTECWSTRALASGDTAIEAGDRVTLTIEPEDCFVFRRDPR